MGGDLSQLEKIQLFRGIIASLVKCGLTELMIKNISTPEFVNMITAKEYEENEVPPEDQYIEYKLSIESGSGIFAFRLVRCR